MNRAGKPCRAPVRAGDDWCVFHDPSPEGRARHVEQSRKGGRRSPYEALAAPPIAEAIDVAALDLEAPEGIRALLGAALGQLAYLPFDVRVANALSQAVTAQGSLIKTSDLADRLADLERLVARLGPPALRVG